MFRRRFRLCLFSPSRQMSVDVHFSAKMDHDELMVKVADFWLLWNLFLTLALLNPLTPMRVLNKILYKGFRVYNE